MPTEQTLMEMVRDIYQRGGELADDLRAKCRWEQMTPIEVLREWPEFERRYYQEALAALAGEGDEHE